MFVLIQSEDKIPVQWAVHFNWPVLIEHTQPSQNSLYMCTGPLLKSSGNVTVWTILRSAYFKKTLKDCQHDEGKTYVSTSKMKIYSLLIFTHATFDFPK